MDKAEAGARPAEDQCDAANPDCSNRTPQCCRSAGAPRDAMACDLMPRHQPGGLRPDSGHSRPGSRHYQRLEVRGQVRFEWPAETRLVSWIRLVRIDLADGRGPA